mgnify:CR=1 FL=1
MACPDPLPSLCSAMLATLMQLDTMIPQYCRPEYWDGHIAAVAREVADLIKRAEACGVKPLTTKAE